MRETRASFCRICASYCPILVSIDDGRAVEVRGDPQAPLYDGYTCPKGRALPDQHNSPTRLHSSMKRGSHGHYHSVPSAQAMDEIAARVTNIIDAHGPRSVALYFGTGIASFPEVANIASAWMAAIKSPMTFSANAIDKPGAQIAQAAHGMWSAWHPPFDEAEAWMVVGLNPFISKSGGFPPNNPGRRLKEAVKSRDMKLIVIDPRLSETARKAHIHLQAKPGEDPAILAAMINVILQEKLYDADFVAENVDGVEALQRAVRPFSPAIVADRAGVSADALVDAARIFARARYAGVGCGVGPSFSLTGALTDYMSLCLTTICGFWSRAGDKVQKPNVLLPDYVPRAEAMPPFKGSDYDEKLRVRGLAASASGMPTGALADEILLEGEGQVKALFCLGGNPMMAWPDQHRALKALQSLELLVTNDYEMSATARLSDYVIAPKLTLETPNTSALLENIRYIGHTRGIDGPYAHYTPAVAAPPPGSDLIEDWEFYYGLAERMSLPLTIRTSYGMGEHVEAPPHAFTLDFSSKPTTDELLDRIFSNARIPLDEVKRHPHGHVFGKANQTIQPKRPGYAGRLDVGNAPMMAQLDRLNATPRAPCDSASDFLLIPRRTNKLMNSGGRSLALLTGPNATNPAYMHPEDIAALGVVEGDYIDIASEVGRITAIVAPEPGVRRGCVSITHGYGLNPGEDEIPEAVGCNVGRLMSTDAEFDPITGIPRMGALAVTITRAVQPVSKDIRATK